MGFLDRDEAVLQQATVCEAGKSFLMSNSDVEEAVLVENINFEAYSEEIKKLREKRVDLIHEQHQLLTQKLSELSPIISFIINHGFYFKHKDPEVNLAYANGPVLMMDDKKTAVYVYNSKKNLIEKVDRYSRKQLEEITTYNFVERHNIGPSLESLHHLTEFPGDIINGLSDECQTREETIKKYKS